MNIIFDRLTLIATCLAFAVVVLGAYVRLSDAGLGCPDWPGCYGHLSVPKAEQAAQAFPDKPLVKHKAWKEMVHRYFAATLGLLILAIFIVSILHRQELGALFWIPSVLVLVVAFQGALGMWTVTLLLKPVIVSLHLLGGMTTLALLCWISARRRLTAIATNFHPVWLRVGLIVIGLQIALGGWTSTNYAALACGEFPRCQGVWWPNADFLTAFSMLGSNAFMTAHQGLSDAALTAIQLAHRCGAMVTFLYLFLLGVLLLRSSSKPSMGVLLLGLLFAQIALGISNVVFGLPLWIAVAHNAGAASLMIFMVAINSKIVRGRS